MAYPPAALSTNATDGASPTDTTPTAVLTAAEVNATNAAVNDVVAELGANPSGAAASVAARLDGVDSAIAGLSGTYAAKAGTVYTGAHDFTAATVTGVGGTLAAETYLDAQIPIVEITTAAKAPITSKTTYLDAVITIKGGRPDRDPFVSTVQIRGRGNYTWTLPKKPYRLRLPSTAPASILGMPTDRDWVLLANATDNTGIRTAMSLWIGRNRPGLAWTPRFRWVELYLNGIYQGLYQLGEHVKVATSRVNITKMASGDVAGLALTGGYSLEIDERLESDPTVRGFRTTLQNVPVTFDDPDGAVTAQFNYLRDHINAFESALYGGSWLDPTTGYARYIDMPSFVDWYLVEELCSNQDSNFYSSCKLHKQRDTVDAVGKIVMGPLWDFDISLGNVVNLSHPSVGFFTRNGAKWIARMFSDPAFYSMLVTRWQSLRDFLLTSTAANNQISLYTATVHGALLRDMAFWSYSSDWSATSAAMKTWLADRIAWLDTQFTLANAPTGPLVTTPGAPTGLTGTPAGTQVALSWTAPSNNGGAAITDYRVEYKLAADEAWLTFTDGVSTSTSATVTGLTTGSTYDLRVAAVNSAGFGATAAVRVVVTAPLGPPTGLTPTPGNTQVALSWTAPSGTGGNPITDYLVEYKASASGTWLTFTDGVSTTPSATVTGLVNGTAYDFRVSTVTSAATSSPSSTVTATPAASVTTPGAPTGLAGTSGNAQVALSWTAPASNGGAAITDYLVEYKLASSGTWLTFADGTSSATSATVTGLTNNSAYDFRVSAVNSAGTGTASGTATVTPSAYLMFDDFNRADGALGTLVTGQTWQDDYTAGAWQVSSNQARLTSNVNGSTTYANLPAGVNDVVVSATLAVLGVSPRIIGRKTGENYYLVGVYDGMNGLYLSRIVGGASTLLGDFAITILAGDVIGLSMKGSTIKMQRNGVDVLTVTDSAIASGTGCGFRHGAGNMNYRWDNFTVVAAP